MKDMLQSDWTRHTLCIIQGEYGRGSPPSTEKMFEKSFHQMQCVATFRKQFMIFPLLIIVILRSSGHINVKEKRLGRIALPKQIVLKINKSKISIISFI